MAGYPPPSSNLWGYVAFQEALEGARERGVVADDAQEEVFQSGFLAAWDRMERAVEEGHGWPPVDEQHLRRVELTLKWIDAEAGRWRAPLQDDAEEG